MRTAKRRIDIEASTLDDGLMEVRAVLSDTFHDMELQFTITEKGYLIKTVSAQMTRAAHNNCSGALDNLQKLVGLRFGRGFNRKAQEVIGGTNGCTHMTNLVLQVNAASVTFIDHVNPEEISELHWSQRPVEFFTKKYPKAVGACFGFYDDGQRSPDKKD